MGPRRSAATASVALLICLAGLACGAGRPQSAAGPSRAPSFPPAVAPYAPEIDPADFVATIDNPYMPLEPGTTYVYRGASEGESERDVVVVTNETKEILGVICIVVRDVVSTQGEIKEKTFDWYAQDRYGNVWYFGEDSKEYENGKPASAAGSWEAGADGALPGIVMLGDPTIGDLYRQEYYSGEAEDFGRILKLDASVDVPYGSYDNVLVTVDSTPLDPKLVEHKYYARGVGVIEEQAVKGPSEVSRLVSVSSGY
jgi:hypothetical protein